MKNRNRSIFALAPLLLLAQVAISPLSRAAEPRYRLIDLGSLGGNRFNAHFSGVNGRLLNNDGTVVGGMATADADLFGWDSDGLTSHAFEWQDDSLTDLGATAFNDKGNFSQVFWINALGHSVGIATYNASSVGATPLFNAVLWKDRQMIDLGTLGGDQSYAHAINNHGQTVGWALDAVVSSEQIWFSYPWPFLTQQRAALWENGSVRDLGTLGGPCAWAMGINDAGQVIGQSFTTNATGEPKNVVWNAGDWPWTRPVAGFIWQNGTMVDLGNLGGTWVLPLRINQRGQVIGWATMPGDNSYHPFLWDQGVIRDLGTLGGNNGSANDMNAAGEVVGGTQLAGGGFHAFLWRNGVMTDLGSVRQRSQAWHINSKSQIVGTTGDGFATSDRAFLWENGGPMVDLNTLVPEDSPLILRYTLGINDAGEILCYGVLPNGDSRPALLIPVPIVAAPAGKLVAWGDNQYGQTNVPAGNDFVAIDAGQAGHSLALRSNGSLAGWGSNKGDPELGSGDVLYGQATVPPGNDFQAIAAGAFHSLALKTNGSLVGWGSNEIFHGGNPSGQATVPAGNDFVAIAAGDWHSLALKSDGSLVAWGDNSEGQTTVPTGNDFVAIASGDFHGLALKSDGSLAAWGLNDTGQLNVPAGNDFVAIAAGWGQNLAVKSNGLMVGWGWNNYGQATPRAGNGFVAVAAGWHHSLALRSNGSLVAWGGNAFGQTIVPAGTNFVAISAGGGHGLAIQVAPPPDLNIARVGNNVVLSWSTDDSAYTLEANTDLSSPLNWSKVPGTPTVAGKEYSVTDAVTSGDKFYRLKR